MVFIVFLTLFTTLFTVVCSLKSMCMPSSIGCCVSELHGHLCRYCNLWPKAVHQKFHCLPNCLHIYISELEGCYKVTKFHSSTPLVSEIPKCIA